ncbi:MAG: hypothetical protein ACJ8GW_01665 [Massilia sp.]
MKKLPASTPDALYGHVTGHVAEQIAYFMADARRKTGADADAQTERAYGLYLGWRAFAPEMTTPSQYLRDDLAIERLIVARGSPETAPRTSVNLHDPKSIEH